VSLAIRKYLIFFVPMAIVIATFMLLPMAGTLPPERRELVVVAPYLLAISGMLLAVHFHRGRPFAALLMVIFFYWSYRTFNLESGITGFTKQGVYLALISLLPPNLALFAFMRERGVFSTAGRMRFAFLVLQAGAAGWLFRYHLEDVLPYITRQLVHLAPLDNQLIPQPLLALALLSVIVIAALTVRRQAPIESGLLGALAALLIASARITTPDLPALYCASASLIITLSILQDSYNMAFRDDLTGLPSRRALNEALHGLGRRYTIAMLDVDHFKKFNDTYGHDTGDQVLKMVAKKMMSVSGGGKAYRYGGEEFTVLFPGKRSAEAISHLETLRQAIADYKLAIRDVDRSDDKQEGEGKRGSKSSATTVSVTISIGVAESGEGDGGTAEVMKSADKALYKAKRGGRNRVCCE
jgi:diguanylate cyclase (GGDEF)-like protein